jgi:hypothetical protein
MTLFATDCDKKFFVTENNQNEMQTTIVRLGVLKGDCEMAGKKSREPGPGFLKVTWHSGCRSPVEGD